ncbi:hypothetical protein [Streptomyces bauhiniae]|uniref:Uncharacterized protein n=1 Tax=Streptomyces bauhiniae TaxID=2340725 RepID=A0A7K3QTI0_9ACTN|nr:hypothetical protein [Streptomyces bauhiniae]NEB93186.1 hypothetical protein [Streptomyces bauhiniae]
MACAGYVWRAPTAVPKGTSAQAHATDRATNAVRIGFADDTETARTGLELLGRFLDGLAQH